MWALPAQFRILSPTTKKAQFPFARGLPWGQGYHFGQFGGQLALYRQSCQCWCKGLLYRQCTALLAVSMLWDSSRVTSLSSSNAVSHLKRKMALANLTSTISNKLSSSRAMQAGDWTIPANFSAGPSGQATLVNPYPLEVIRECPLKFERIR